MKMNIRVLNRSTVILTSKKKHNLATTLILLRSLWINLALFSAVITKIHSHEAHRCSHVPPTPEQVHHVWLSNSNGDFNVDEITSFYSRQDTNSSFTIVDGIQNDNSTTRNKNKRQISSYYHRALVGSNDKEIQNSIWNILRRLEKPIHSEREELVPMKIQVHYDSSVYLLEKAKQNLINYTVMPTVVEFFENLLSIRREFTIDRFRISRRCPNNTIYYARDSFGNSRSYCMERCEDHAICGEIVVPKEHLLACSYCNSTSKRCTTNYSSEGKGVANTQLLLYVSAKQTTRCKRDQTIAYAAHCAQDTKTDRPVAGHANLCPSSISTDPKDLRALIATVKHELTHVLGFSVSLFAYYRDEYGQPLTERESFPGPISVDPAIGYAKWSDKVIKKIVRPGWSAGKGLINKEVNLMVTPTVVREVRRHFNCSSLEGAELEDQGSDGTSMTHWEKRLFENEAMTGTHTQNSVYSRLSLAVLQDTGWYVANFSKADKLDWGRDLGCDFAKKSCKTWINERRAKNLSIRPFCDRVKSDSLQISCTDDRTSKAVCNMRQYKEPLPEAYRNFDYLEGVSQDLVPHFGGSVDLADYCPFVQEFTWQAQNVTVRGSRCDLVGNNIDSDRNAALEHYGPDSRCFEHGSRWEQRSCNYKRHWHHYGAGCYKYFCADGHVNVVVGNHTYSCYYPEQELVIEQFVDSWLYNGTLICPACDKICPVSKCKLYNKELIDKIISIAEYPEIALLLNSPNSEDQLQDVLDNVLNSIDTDSMPQNSSLSLNKLSSQSGKGGGKVLHNFIVSETENDLEGNSIADSSEKKKKQLDYAVSLATHFDVSKSASLSDDANSSENLTLSKAKAKATSSKSVLKDSNHYNKSTNTVSVDQLVANATNTDRSDTRTKYREYLIHLLAQHERGPTPRQSLICSSGVSMNANSYQCYAYPMLVGMTTALLLRAVLK